ncbi:MAG: RNA polymerase sigma factor [Luteolibacter sp.]
MRDFSEQTDQALLRAYVREGNEGAFSELVKRHQAMAVATASRVCGNQTEVKDILQQSLLVLARRAPSLIETKCLGAWLHRVVLLQAKNSIRKSATRKKNESKAHEMSHQQYEPAVPDRLAPELDETLDSMSQKDREVLTLHYLEGHSFKAISASLGGTSVAWQKRSVRALEKLASKLKTRGIAVSTTALMAVLSSSQAEAGITASILDNITRSALDQTTGGSSYFATKSAILLSMKTGLTACLLGGGLLAFGWNKMSPPIENRPPSAARGELGIEMLPVRPVTQRSERKNVFSLELVEQAISEYQNSTERKRIKESRLRSLMFLVPEKYLEDVLALLMEQENPAEFRDIASSLFARWAEIDPEAAYARAQSLSTHKDQATRAVILTWLNVDTEQAVAHIIEKKSPQYRDYLKEFLGYQAHYNPEESAALLDLIVADWPEANPQLLGYVADLWSRQNALASAEWVAGEEDSNLKNKILRTMAQDVAAWRGYDSLVIADLVDDPKQRQRARNKAIEWWGVSGGGPAVVAERASPQRDLTGGFPEDWSDAEIRIFSKAVMINYAKNLPDLLKIASSDEQRILIAEGAVSGGSLSNPADVSSAVEALPESYADTKAGRSSLSRLATRWQQIDGKGLEAWLSQQPEDKKTDVMRNAVNAENTK